MHHFEQEKDSSPLNILWDSRLCCQRKFKVDHQVEALSWLHCLGCPVDIISLSIELVSLSARVTSIKSATTSLSELVRDRDRDP